MILKKFYRNDANFVGRVQLKCDGTWWRTEGKWRGNWLMEWVASTLHTTPEHGVSSITTADAHISAASSRMTWCPRQFKWTRPFRRKKKSGFCACATTFQTQSNIWVTFFYIWVSVHHKSIIYIYNKPTRCDSGCIVFIKNYKYALHVSDALRVHLQEHYKL